MSRAETYSDIYLISPISDECLVKLREGAYPEIKQRRADTAPLQRWSLARRMTFPLDTEELLEVAVSLGLAEMPDRSAAVSGAHLVAAPAERRCACGRLRALPDVSREAGRRCGP